MSREVDLENNSQGLYEKICEKINFAKNEEIKQQKIKQAQLFCQELNELTELYNQVSDDLIKNQENADIHIKLPSQSKYRDSHFIHLKNSSVQKIGEDCVRVKKIFEESDYDGWDSFEYVEGYKISFRCWEKNLLHHKNISFRKRDGEWSIDD